MHQREKNLDKKTHEPDRKHDILFSKRQMNN